MINYEVLLETLRKALENYIDGTANDYTIQKDGLEEIRDSIEERLSEIEDLEQEAEDGEAGQEDATEENAKEKP